MAGEASGGARSVACFEPEPGSLRGEALALAVGCVFVVPAVCWWRGLSWWVTAAISAASFVGVLASDVYKLRIRGRDRVELGEDAITVTNRRGSWSLPWTGVFRVYTFKEVLAFETPAPHRRFYLSLEGHEAHRRALVAAIGARAKAKDMKWFDTVVGLLG